MTDLDGGCPTYRTADEQTSSIFSWKDSKQTLVSTAPGTLSVKQYNKKSHGLIFVVNPPVFRYALEFVFVSNVPKDRYGTNVTRQKTTTLDDEHTPGIFTVSPYKQAFFGSSSATISTSEWAKP